MAATRGKRGGILTNVDIPDKYLSSLAGNPEMPLKATPDVVAERQRLKVNTRVIYSV